MSVHDDLCDQIFERDRQIRNLEAALQAEKDAREKAEGLLASAMNDGLTLDQLVAAQGVKPFDLNTFAGFLSDEEADALIAEMARSREGPHIKQLAAERERVKALEEALREVRAEIVANYDLCNHPPVDGSDDPCDGDDCILCFVTGTVDAALAAPGTQAAISPIPASDEREFISQDDFAAIRECPLMKGGPAESDIDDSLGHGSDAGTPPCAGCGGPHPFDTSIPSAVWNAVIRSAGLPDYLCTTCIVRAFVKAERGFTAALWGTEFYDARIELVIGGNIANDAAAVSEENTQFRVKLREVAERGSTQRAALRLALAPLKRSYDDWAAPMLDRDDMEKILRAAGMLEEKNAD